MIFTDLPTDVVVIILSHCEINDVFTFLSTSKYINELYGNEYTLWSRLFDLQFRGVTKYLACIDESYNFINKVRDKTYEEKCLMYKNRYRDWCRSCKYVDIKKIITDKNNSLEIKNMFHEKYLYKKILSYDIRIYILSLIFDSKYVMDYSKLKLIYNNTTSGFFKYMFTKINKYPLHAEFVFRTSDHLKCYFDTTTPSDNVYRKINNGMSDHKFSRRVRRIIINSDHISDKRKIKWFYSAIIRRIDRDVYLYIDYFGNEKIIDILMNINETDFVHANNLKYDNNLKYGRHVISTFTNNDFNVFQKRNINVDKIIAHILSVGYKIHFYRY
uniref:F-box-like protein n=1 Tax=Pithovirus LCPAC101 TaxID=2506586 RepID=A0A481Z1Y7_9VIRU|nr:MAG: F-box-like protein [Pithovirus LCPAC101]